MKAHGECLPCGLSSLGSLAHHGLLLDPGRGKRKQNEGGGGGGGGGEPWIETSAAGRFPCSPRHAPACLTPVQNDSETGTGVSSCRRFNFPLRCFLQEFQCPGFSGRRGAAPTYGHRVAWGHRVSWVPSAAGSDTRSGAKGVGFVLVRLH